MSQHFSRASIRYFFPILVIKAVAWCLAQTMLQSSSRLLCPAGLRETVCSVSARLGYLGTYVASPIALVRQDTRLNRPPLAASASEQQNGSHRGASTHSVDGAGRVGEVAVEHSGRIDLILGPMFAGKTSELLRRVEEHEAAGWRVAVVKSTVDTRYHATKVVSHDGMSKDCYAAGSLAEFRRQAGDEYRHFQVIAIDEAQFLPDLLDFCTWAADVDRKHILLAGLDGDFKRQRFGQVLDVVSVADTVTKLAGQCAYCGRAALFSLRIAADSRQAVVGGSDKYAPVCRRHYGALHQGAVREEVAAAGGPAPVVRLRSGAAQWR